MSRKRDEEKAKNEVLEKALADIEKKYGANTVYIGDKSNKADIKIFDSGILTMDAASNLGGLPRGRVLEYYGIESSGKTTAALLNIAAAQARGEKCAFIDAEQAIDPNWARKLGVNWDELIFSQPESAEKAFYIIEKLVSSGVVSLIVLDSIAALTLEDELKEDLTDVGFPVKARMLSAAFRKLTSIMSNCKYSTLICLNHKMEKIGQFGHGDKSTTPGGKALKFYSSMRVEFTRISWINEKGEDDRKIKIGSEIQIKFVKNKCASPYGTNSYDFLFGIGVDLVQETIDLGVKYGVIERKGEKDKSCEFFYKEENIANGLKGIKSYLNNNSEVLKELRDKISEKIKESPKPVVKEENEENPGEEEE